MCNLFLQVAKDKAYNAQLATLCHSVLCSPNHINYRQEVEACDLTISVYNTEVKDSCLNFKL